MDRQGSICDFSEGLDAGCANCKLKKASLLNELHLNELDTIDSNRKVFHFKKGDVIFKEGSKPNGVLCLKKGKVKLSKIGVEGIEHITGLRKPVDFIGYRSLIAEKEYSSTAIALDNCTICVIKKEDFFEVVKSNNSLALKMMQSLATELIDRDERIVNLTQKHMRGRLAETLILLKDVYGLLADNESLTVSLKRSELASLSNMTTSNAIRVLSAFSKEKLIELDRRNIKIKNISGLKKISELNN